MKVGDKLSDLPDSFVTIATTSNSPFAGISHETKPYYGIQWHAEVAHSKMGRAIMRNFAVNICEARQHWTMDEFVSKEIQRIRDLVGEKGQVIGRSTRNRRGLHRAKRSQARYLGGSTLRFVSIQ